MALATTHAVPKLELKYLFIHPSQGNGNKITTSISIKNPEVMLSILLVLLGLCSNVHAKPIFPHIIFTYQSQAINVTTWFDYITVCLAPLIAHVAGGVSPTTPFSSSSSSSGDPRAPSSSSMPSWTAHLPHFNPISILWRYYAIADRRVRAKDWDSADMAACNAVFWDVATGRFDGSEEIMVKSRAWLTKVPDHSHVQLLSASGLTSVVLTLQATQAMFLIVAALVPNVPYGFGDGLPYVFFPLACLGLPRLVAAFWLSGDYGYLNAENLELVRGVTRSSVGTAEKAATGHVVEYLVGEERPVEASVSDRLYGRHCSRGIVYRIFWIVSSGALLGTSATATSELWWGYPENFPYTSMSHLMLMGMYFVTSSTALLIYCTYVLMGRTHTTLIPCIHSTWYKIFTIILMAMALVTVISYFLETRQLLDGTTTTYPEFYCANLPICIPVAPGHGDTNI